MLSNNKKMVVLVGPTASGKSDLAVKIAKKIDGEIISADSRQVYRGLDIGSGKITKKEMRGVKHYCLDIANPKKVFTAEDFKKCFNEAMQKIIQKNKIPIVVGGTGFYIDVALGRIKTAEIPPNRALRKKLAKKSAKELFRMLKKLDPKRAKNIDKNNPVRLIRAIEIFSSRSSFASENSLTPSRKKSESYSATARPHLEFSSAKLERESILWLGTKRPKQELKKRIHVRLLKRIPGIIKEIKKLRRPPAGGGLSWRRLFDLGLEYRYVSLFLRGKLNKKEMAEKLETEIRKYAKRQMTWFKRNKEIHWISNEKEAGVFTGPLAKAV